MSILKMYQEKEIIAIPREIANGILTKMHKNTTKLFVLLLQASEKQQEFSITKEALKNYLGIEYLDGVLSDIQNLHIIQKEGKTKRFLSKIGAKNEELVFVVNKFDNTNLLYLRPYFLQNFTFSELCFYFFCRRYTQSQSKKIFETNADKWNNTENEWRQSFTRKYIAEVVGLENDKNFVYKIKELTEKMKQTDIDKVELVKVEKIRNERSGKFETDLEKFNFVFGCCNIRNKKKQAPQAIQEDGWGCL